MCAESDWVILRSVKEIERESCKGATMLSDVRGLFYGGSVL